MRLSEVVCKAYKWMARHLLLYLILGTLLLFAATTGYQVYAAAHRLRLVAAECPPPQECSKRLVVEVAAPIMEAIVEGLVWSESVVLTAFFAAFFLCELPLMPPLVWQKEACCERAPQRGELTAPPA